MYVTHIKFKDCLDFRQNVVEKLPSFVKLVSPFRKPIYKAAFLGSSMHGLSRKPSYLVAFLGHTDATQTT